MLDDDPDKLLDEYQGDDVDEGEHVVLPGAGEDEREPDEVEL